MSTPPPIPQGKPTRPSLAIKALLVLLVVCGVILGICLDCGMVRNFVVRSGSMEPAVERGDYVVVTHFGSHYRRGDIVAFNAPNMRDPTTTDVFIKRVVGLPGETLRIVDGTLTVNGVRTPLYNRAGAITYVFLPTKMFPMRADNSYTVPSGSYFVLGDNSPHSYDSRHFGYIPTGAILGRVTTCYAPWNRMGTIQ